MPDGPAGSCATGEVERPTLDVRTFVEELSKTLPIEVLAGGEGLGRSIRSARIQKLSLALAGFTRQIRTGRVQVVGESEVEYCKLKDADERTRVLDAACAVPVTAFLVTKGLEPPEELLQQAEKHGVPVMRSSESSSHVISSVQEFLRDWLAPRVRLHGVLVDVHGLGVLLIGHSGIGKSECALDLVQRGHRLVADDAVEIRQHSPEVLVGNAVEKLRNHLELRGVGILDVTHLYGITAVRRRKRVELVVRLVPLGERDHDRLGVDDATFEILGVELPFHEMPVAPGRTLAMVIEVAARNHMLKLRGYHPARELVERLDRLARRRSDE